MKKFAVALVACGMLLCGAAGANALTIGGDGVAGYYADYGPNTTAWNTDLMLNQFDPSLGTLTKIELFLSGSETSTATVTAGSQGASWLSVSVQTIIRLLDPTNITTTLVLVTPAVSDTGGSLSAGGTYNLVGSGNDSESTTLTSGAAFNLFIGSGTISLPTSAISYGSTTALSGGTFSPTGTASEHLYVVYTYDESSPVPEPATMLLFGTGLAGLAALSRRKKA